METLMNRLMACVRWITTPTGLRVGNLWFTVFWLVLVIPTIFVPVMRESVLWVALLSIWANVISHFTAYIAARVDVRAEDIEADVEELEEKSIRQILADIVDDEQIDQKNARLITELLQRIDVEHVSPILESIRMVGLRLDEVEANIIGVKNGQESTGEDQGGASG